MANNKAKKDWSQEGELPYSKIPVYKAAYDCLKECMLRFRNTPSDFKPLTRDIRLQLSRIMVCIAHARLNFLAAKSLQEATDLALQVQIGIRLLDEVHAIPPKSYAILAQLADSLVRQMVGWARSQKVWEGDYPNN